MKYNKLGQTDMSVSHVCLGTMTWGSQNTEVQAHEQMDYAVDQGINFFDTAELYAIPPEEHTQGLTEQYIGSWFAKTGKREDIILASKICGGEVHFGIPWIDDAMVISPERVELAIERSLKRLQTDYIDLYQLHWPNYRYPHHGAHHAGAINHTAIDTAQAEDEFLNILRALDKSMKAGKIRSFGLSNDSAWGTMKYLELAKEHDLPRAASVQNEFSMLYRHDDPYLTEVCVHEEVAYLPYSPLAAGSLSGKYLDGARPDGSRWSLDSRKNQRDTTAAQSAVRAYMDIASKHGLDMCQMALAFCYQQPFVTSTIIGATTLGQLKSNIDAKDIVLSDDIMNDIQAVYKQYPTPY
jgi:aryl-alcohol dehydrogenase-like predicted oxidoreductase